MIIKEKANRYKMAIEALQEIIDNDNEIDAIKHMNIYLKEQLHNINKCVNDEVNPMEIPVKDFQFVKP